MLNSNSRSASRLLTGQFNALSHLLVTGCAGMPPEHAACLMPPVSILPRETIWATYSSERPWPTTLTVSRCFRRDRRAVSPPMPGSCQIDFLFCAGQRLIHALSVEPDMVSL